jgi:hypothetical protein
VLDEHDETVNGGSYAPLILEQPGTVPAPVGQPRPPLLRSPLRSPAAKDALVETGSEPDARKRATGELERARGAFEPPPEQHPGLANLRHIDYDLLAGDSVDSLDRLKSLYETAQGLDGEILDKHFGELLETQRKLVSAFFSGNPASARSGR